MECIKFMEQVIVASYSVLIIIVAIAIVNITVAFIIVTIAIVRVLIEGFMIKTAVMDLQHLKLLKLLFSFYLSSSYVLTLNQNFNW